MDNVSNMDSSGSILTVNNRGSTTQILVLLFICFFWLNDCYVVWYVEAIGGAV